jgi:hypothetical protein
MSVSLKDFALLHLLKASAPPKGEPPKIRYNPGMAAPILAKLQLPPRQDP